MDAVTWFVSLPSSSLFLLSTIIGVLAAEVGVWMAQRKKQKGVRGKEPSIGSLIGAMLGLLAFMLGFTFSITSTRFSDRKQLVMEQATAIGTCYLRTSLLPEKQKAECRRFLQEYIGVLVQMQEHSEIEKGISKLEALHLLIWNQAASLANENMDSELRSLFVSSVNEMIDVFRERKTVALIYRIPRVLWTTLYLLFMLSMFVVGYEIGTYPARRILDTPLLAASFALIVALIANMDSTRGKLRFRVSQQPLVEVKAIMQRLRD